MRVQTVISKVNRAESDKALKDIFSKVELDSRKKERDRIINIVLYMLSSHSGHYWGTMNADTAVTEYRGILSKKVGEIE